MSVTFNPGVTHAKHNDDAHITDKEWNEWAKWYKDNKSGQEIDFGGRKYTLAQLQDMRKAGLIVD